LSGSFVNQLFEYGIDGWNILISDQCKVAIDDYIMVKENKNGEPDKKTVRDERTGITYEPYGHYTDVLRYACTTMLSDIWAKYSGMFTAYTIGDSKVISRNDKFTM
jgi:alpha-mannosidase